MPRRQSFEERFVLDRAVNLFWEKGYCDTSAQNIVDALGLNRSSIYNTFSDKKTLFKKALQHYREQQSAGLRAMLEVCEPDIGIVRELLEHIAFAALDAQTCKGCLIVNTAVELGDQDEDVHEIISGNIEEVVAAFEKFIGKGQQIDVFPGKKSARDLAIFLFHGMTALRVTSKVVRDRAFLQSNIDVILQTFTKS